MTYLYRHYDHEGNLLYVGISLSFAKRTRDHSKNSHWFKEIATIKIQKCKSRQQAMDLERKAIAEEKPLHNLKRPTITEVKEKNRQESKQELLKRIVQFNPTYSLDEAAHIIGVGLKMVKNWIEEGVLGYIEVGQSSHRWGVTPKRRITGWQLIDFIEYLESRTPINFPHLEGSVRIEQDELWTVM